MILSITLGEVPHSPLISLPGSEALWRFSHGALSFGINYSRPDSDRDSLSNLILDGKYVCKVPVISFGPNMAGVGCVDQLSRHSDPVCRALHAPFEDVANAKLTADFADVDRLALVGETRVSCNYEQPAELR